MFTVTFPDLPGCLITAQTIEEALELAKETKKDWLLLALSEGVKVKKPEQLNSYSCQFGLNTVKVLN